MVDVKGTALPHTDRIAIPQAEARIWGDRAVGVAVEPGPDGSGVTVRITNTGRQAIPAVPDWVTAAPSDDEIQEVRTTVTVIATAIQPSKAAPVVLLSAPLAEAMQPGESVAFDVPGISAATARTTNWLSVDLRLPDDPTWAAAYLPVGILRSGSALGELTPPAPALPDGQAVTGTQPGSAAHHVVPARTPAPTAAPTPTPKPSPLPSAPPSTLPTATPSVAPAATPAPTRSPKPETRNAPAPSPKVTAAPTPAPTREPATKAVSERSRAIRYRGAWSGAPHGGYMGGSVAWSKDRGATATFTFTGTSVKWVGPLGPTRGRAVVLIDGRAVARVSLWNATFVPRAVVFKRTFKATGRHTLTIKVLSSPGRQTVAIDGFIVRS
jgi:hypothetical protein